MSNPHLSIFIFILLFSFSSCSSDSSPLRGDEKESIDGLTYLVIKEGNNCQTYLIDGVEWEYAIGEAGPIEPGEHTITCHGEIGLIIKEGTTFYFDYWGP